MCYRIKIKKDKKMAQISAYGNVNILELREIFFETVRHAEWQTDFDMLCDYRNIEHLAITSQDIDDLTEWQRSIDTLIGNGRCAVVATKDFVFGMSRMWELLSTDRSQQIKVFRKIKDAIMWLLYPVRALE
jgi:hypothetical protein